MGKIVFFNKVKKMYNEDLLLVTVCGVTFKMVHVEHGEFNMGAGHAALSYGETALLNVETPVHKVLLTRNYYIGETLVTQELWRTVMNENPSWFGEGGNGSHIDEWENLPVERVSWNDCQKFISKLNHLTGLKFRLPTEAEWEFAARGGNKSNGFNYSGSNNSNEVAWCDEETHPVKRLTPNELGIYDMSGNVEEWCQDWYGPSYYDNSPQTDPKGPESPYVSIYGNVSFKRVIRGGWIDNEIGLRFVSSRNFEIQDYEDEFIGLRLALSE